MVEKGRGFQVFAHILLVFLSLCAVAPFILLIMSSFTEEQTLITNNTQHDTTKKRSRKSGSSCYFRGMRGYISISKSSGFRRLPGTAIFL